MKQYKGFGRLLEERANLPSNVWIFFDRSTTTETTNALREAIFYVPENEDDEFDGEEVFSTLVETATFLSILRMREKSIKKPSNDQYLSALVHYLELDDFLE